MTRVILQNPVKSSAATRTALRKTLANERKHFSRNATHLNQDDNINLGLN